MNCRCSGTSECFGSIPYGKVLFRICLPLDVTFVIALSSFGPEADPLGMLDSTLFQLQTDETIDGQMLLKEFERRDSTTPENFHIQMDCATENICSICIR